MEKFTSEEARTGWRRLLNLAQKGESSVVTRYGEPAAMVIPWELGLDLLTYAAAGAPNSREARMLAEAKAVAARAGEDAEAGH